MEKYILTTADRREYVLYSQTKAYAEKKARNLMHLTGQPHAVLSSNGWSKLIRK